jgi:predicted RNA-binding protein
MAYWINVTTSENWAITKETSILGAAERYRKSLSQLSIGDRCLIYVRQHKVNKDVIGPRIVAEYEVASKPFDDKQKIFGTPPGMANEAFPQRVKLKPLRIFKKPIEFKPLILRLAFIKNKKNWAAHLQGRAIIKITEQDYDSIVASARKTN